MTTSNTLAVLNNGNVNELVGLDQNNLPYIQKYMIKDISHLLDKIRDFKYENDSKFMKNQ